MTLRPLSADFGPGPIGSGTQQVVLIAFLGFVGVLLLLSVLGSPDRDEVADFYAANRSLGLLRHTLALSGDYISAETMLGTIGIVAVSGYDGMALAVDTALAMGGLLLLAEPLRNAGRYTLGDIFAQRAHGVAPRIAAAAAILAISLPFLVVELSIAGGTTALLVGLTNPGAQQACTVFAGVLMITYTVLGGMAGTSLVQILKAVVVFSTMTVLALLVLHHFHWSVSDLLTAAEHGSGSPDAYLRPGQQLGRTTTGRLDFVGLQLSLVLGGACMPHLIMRVNTATSGPAARRSTRYGIGMTAVFCLLVIIAGLGTAAVVDDRFLTAVTPNGQAALPLLAAALEGGTSTGSGSALFTAVACAVFVTVLTVVAGLTLAAAAALAHDIHAQTVRRGRITEAEEMKAGRWAVVSVGALGILIAVAVQGYNVHFLTTLSIAIAASTVLPALIYSLFWRRFHRTGLLWTVYGGLTLTVGLYAFGPLVSGTPFALFPHRDFHWFPLQNGGLISVPAGFLLGWTGSAWGRRHTNRGRAEPDFTRAEARILAAAGSE